MVPHGVLDGSVICNCGNSSSLVFEILLLLMVYWMGLWSVFVAFSCHWYLRLFCYPWCTGWVCDLYLWHFLVIGI